MRNTARDGAVSTRCELMNWFHKLISKRMWFLGFNAIMIFVLIVSGRIQMEAVSIASYFIALLIVNVIALISARNFPDWK